MYKIILNINNKKWKVTKLKIQAFFGKTNIERRIKQ